jgi:hypothetical protein
LLKSKFATSEEVIPFSIKTIIPDESALFETGVGEAGFSVFVIAVVDVIGELGLSGLLVVSVGLTVVAGRIGASDNEVGAIVGEAVITLLEIDLPVTTAKFINCKRLAPKIRPNPNPYRNPLFLNTILFLLLRKLNNQLNLTFV